MKRMQRLLLALWSLPGVAMVGGMLFGSIEIASAEEVESVLPPVVASAAPSVAAIPTETAAPSTLPWPTALARVAPAIVKVRRDFWWGSGVVFGPHGTIATSYELVNGPGALEVVLPDGVSRKAKVVAWSKEDDLALLKIVSGTLPAPLPAAHSKLGVGVDVVLLYEPRNPELSADTSGGWVTPLPRFTRISRVLPNEVDLDLGLWGSIGDDGAPVVSPSGELVGIISRRTAKERRTIMTRVDRITRLLEQRHLQGEFEPAGRGRWFGMLFVSPLYSTTFDQNRARTAFVGAGVESGYRYNWFFGSVSVAGFESNTRHLSPTVDESRERFQLDFNVGAELQLKRGLDILFGPGLSCVLDTIETTSVSDTSALQAAQTSRGGVRPELDFGFADGAFFARDVFTVSSPPEIRLDLGVMLGQRNF
jgi:S1-C subfamily serine protease